MKFCSVFMNVELIYNARVHGADRCRHVACGVEAASLVVINEIIGRVATPVHTQVVCRECVSLVVAEGIAVAPMAMDEGALGSATALVREHMARTRAMVAPRDEVTKMPLARGKTDPALPFHLDTVEAEEV